MSWPLASFLLVGVCSESAGWLTSAPGPRRGWWRSWARSRPSPRSAATRSSRSPDVKPITAMTLVVGYALGPLPGFTVGALGMLASNVLLGQGPYTPWQMAAWGLVGLAGAALGRLSGRRLGRVQLALACALAAFAAKEVMNVYTWTIGASHTPAALLAVAGTALPFDLTDAVASLLFGFAFGPELARLLARVRARMDSPGRTSSAPSSHSAASCGRPALAGCRPAIAAGAARRPARAAAGSECRCSRAPRRSVAASLARRARLPDLARRTPTAASAPRADSAAASCTPDGPRWASRRPGAIPSSVRRDGHSVLDSLRGEAASLSGLGDAERTILAVRACGASAYSFAGRNLVAEVLRARLSDRSFARQVNLTAFAIFALRAVGHSPRFTAIREGAGWIERQQNGDGGFGFGARALEQRRRRHRRRAAGAHRRGRTQRSRAGRRQGIPDACAEPRRRLPAAARGGESNAQSTAWAVQGLIASGRDPARGSPPRAVARRSAIWKACCPPRTAACATRARPPRRRCGSPRRR